MCYVLTPDQHLNLRRARRWAFRLLGVLIMLPLVWWVSSYAFLNSSFLPDRVSDHPERWMMRWQRAWSPWPGQVEVRGFVLRVQDNDVQWELRIESARADIDLGALTESVFRTDAVTIDGVTFRLRPRLHRDDLAAAQRMAAFPPIAGADEGYIPEPRQAEPSAIEPERWAAALQGVIVHDIRELWLADWRAVVSADAQGALQVAPGHYRLHVAPSRLVVRHASIQRGDRPAATVDAAVIAATVDMPDYRSLVGLDFLTCVAAAVDVTATVDEGMLRGPGFVAGLAAGPAWLEAHVGLDAGALTSRGAVALRGGPATIDLGPFQLQGPWRAQLAIAAKGEPIGHAVVSLGPVVLVDAADEPVLLSTGVTATAIVAPLVVGAAPTLRTLEVLVAPTEPIDLRPLLPSSARDTFALTAGNAVVDGELHWANGEAHGAIGAQITGLRVRVGPQHLSGRAHARIRLSGADLDGSHVDVSGSRLSLDGIRLGKTSGDGATAAPAWNGTLSLSHATVSWHDRPKLQAHVRGTFRDARPLMALIRRRSGIPDFALDSVDSGGLRIQGRVHATSGGVSLADLVVESEDVSGRGNLRYGGGRLRGDVLLEILGFDVGLEISGHDVESHIFGAASWYRSRL